MDHANENERFKKKKKRSFLQHAKKLGKQGSFGKGKSLSEEEYNYYIRVLEEMKNVNGEEKDMLVLNFFRELEKSGEERSLAGNQIVSRILDDFLPVAGIEQVVRFTSVFSEDLRDSCVNPFASHVIQTLLTLSLKYIQKEASQKVSSEDIDDSGSATNTLVSVSDEQKEILTSFIIKIGKFVYNNLEEFTCDTYASHVLRSVLEVCSGVPVTDSIKSSLKSQCSHSLTENSKQVLAVPKALQKLFKDIAVRLMQLPDIGRVICCDCGSAVLQSTLLVSKTFDSTICSDLIAHILTHGFPSVSRPQYPPEEAYSEVPAIFTNNPATRLMEVLVLCASNEQQIEIFEDYYKSKMSSLINDKQANFAVQRLLSSWKEKETFEVLFSQVIDYLSSACEVGHTGVVFALVQACNRLKCQQSRCHQGINQLLECWEPESKQTMLAPLLLRLMPHDSFLECKAKGSLPPISLHGALILQELLHYNKPIKVVKSLLEMPVSELQAMACDPRGSHVINAFNNSLFVGEKSRDKLLYKLKGTFTSLALSKHGSRSLESIWNAANLNFKSEICSELVPNELKLKANPFGAIIYFNFQVRMFKRSDKTDWQQMQTQAEKKRKMCDDLLKDVGASAVSMKKNKNKKKHQDAE